MLNILDIIENKSFSLPYPLPPREGDDNEIHTHPSPLMGEVRGSENLISNKPY
jgi:hypothetical protein